VEGDRGAGDWEKRGREVYGRWEKKGQEVGEKEKNYGLGNFFKWSCPRGRGRANQNNYLFKELWGYTMASKFMEESTYFVQGKSIECVSEWLKKNNVFNIKG